jgi:hypothetical protein
MSLNELQINKIAEEAAEEIGEVILEAVDQTNNDRQRFIIACQIAAQVFGIAGALFQRIPGQEGSHRNEATMAVLNHVSDLAKQPPT